MEAGQLGRQAGQPAVGLLVGDPVVVADLLGQRLGRVATGGEELGVGAAVGHAEQHVRVLHDLLQQVRRALRRRGVEQRAQLVGDGDVEHGVDRVLAR